MKTRVTLWLISIVIGCMPNTGWSGNDHGFGDSTLTPAEKISFPGESLARDKLHIMASWFPEVANSVLDAFEVCEAFKIPKDHPEGRVAEIFVSGSGRCRVYYYPKFFKENPPETVQAEVTLHEAIHYSLRRDPKSEDPQHDIYVQDMGRKVMAANWEKDAFAFEDVVDKWKFAEPEHSFENLPVEQMAKVLAKERTFQFPKPARENSANEMSHKVEVVPRMRDSKNPPDVCLVQVGKALGNYAQPIQLSVSDKGALFGVEPGDTKMSLRSGKFEGEIYEEFQRAILSDSIRSEVNAVGRFRETFKGGSYCQFDLYDIGAEVVGVEVFVLIPKPEKEEKGHRKYRQKALVIWLEYVHS